MAISKVANIVAGFILMVCGVVGCLWPVSVADYYGLVITLPDAKTMIRSMSGFCAGVGCLFVYFGVFLGDQRPVLLTLMIVLCSFAFPRIVGLLVDGLMQPLMWYELAFELFALLCVSIIYFRDKNRYKPRQYC